MNRINLFAALTLAGALLMASDSNAGAMSPAGLARLDGLSVVELAQAKSETLKQKVKRVWRDLTGYKFDVACPAFGLALSSTRCTTTGKDREDARAKCQSQHPFCQVRDAR
jgi:hypothetical protein